MTNPIWEIVLTEAPLAPLPPQFTAEAGGVVEFWGVVRGRENTDEISGIRYECYTEMAQRQLDLLARETAEHFPILGLVLHHRIGFVATAEPSLFLRVSAAHRGPAFDAAQWIVEQLKQRVPIWKHPSPLDSSSAASAPAPFASAITQAIL